MCEYCGTIHNIFKPDKFTEVEIDCELFPTMDVDISGIHDYATTEFKINYCPFCGNPLTAIADPNHSKSLYGRIEDEVNEGVG